MSLSSVFYRYARLCKKFRQRIGYWGIDNYNPDTPIPPTESEFGYPIEINPGDATTTIIPAIIDYPQPNDVYDLPGRLGGPLMNGDNSLTYAGAINDVAEPLGLELTIPSPVNRTVNNTVSGDLTFIRPSLQGETATVTVFLISRYVSSTQVAKLVAGYVTMQYWDGAMYQSGTSTFGWEGGAQMIYNVTLASAQIDELLFKIMFNNVPGLISADYEVNVTVTVGGVVQAQQFGIMTLA